MEMATPVNFEPHITKEFPELGFSIQIQYRGNFLEDLGGGIEPMHVWWFMIHALEGGWLLASGPYKWPAANQLSLDRVMTHISTFYQNIDVKQFHGELEDGESEVIEPHIKALALVQALFYTNGETKLNVSELQISWFQLNGDNWRAIVKPKHKTPSRPSYEVIYDAFRDETTINAYKRIDQYTVDGNYVIK